MAVAITEPGTPAGEDRVGELEARLGASLPANYRRFLVEQNGGKPEPNRLRRDPMVSARYLYALGDTERQYLDLEWANRTSGPFPPQTLAIGCDEGGNSLLLVVRGEGRGAVLFWDHEYELAQTDPDNPTVDGAIAAGTARVVADDFTEFLDGLERR